MDTAGGVSMSPHRPRQLVTLPLGLREHQHLGERSYRTYTEYRQ